MNKFGLMTVALSTMFALPTIAQSKDRAAPPTRADAEARTKERFAQVDANKDGAITLEEIAAARAKREAAAGDKRFAEVDTNKDGSISRAEFDAAQAGRGAFGRNVQIRMLKSGDGNGLISPGVIDDLVTGFDEEDIRAKLEDALGNRKVEIFTFSGKGDAPLVEAPKPPAAK